MHQFVLSLPPTLALVRLNDRDNDMKLTPYGALTRGECLKVPAIQRIAEKRGVGAAEVILNWALAQDIHVLTRSNKAGLRRLNLFGWQNSTVGRGRSLANVLLALVRRLRRAVELYLVSKLN